MSEQLTQREINWIDGWIDALDADTYAAEILRKLVASARSAQDAEQRAERLEAALERLIDAADPHMAAQDHAPDPRCGMTQPISVAEGEELNDAVANARETITRIHALQSAPPASEPEYEHLGDYSAVEPWHRVLMSCDRCKVTWDGCWDNYQCPRCGEGELPWQPDPAPADRPEQAWCQPRDDQAHIWVLIYEDKDKGCNVFRDEAQARAAYEQARQAWTCRLLTSVPYIAERPEPFYSTMDYGGVGHDPAPADRPYGDIPDEDIDLLYDNKWSLYDSDESSDRPEPSEALERALEIIESELDNAGVLAELPGYGDAVEYVREHISQPAPAVPESIRQLPQIMRDSAEMGKDRDRLASDLRAYANDIERTLAAQPSDSPAVPEGDWLWRKLMEWCRKRGVAPADYNDLFSIVGEARAAAPTPTDGGNDE